MQAMMDVMNSSEFLVVGGGVIGMMTARYLAEAGHSVTLIERGHCGEQASWAGGGIVSPLYPWQQLDAINRLAGVSQALYPALADALLDETGIDCELRQRGLLYLAPEQPSAARAWAHRFGHQMHDLTPAAIADCEPGLKPVQQSALSMPALGSVRNPRLCRALYRALEQSPRVRLIEHTEIRRIDSSARQPVAITDNARYSADAMIVCSGAWTTGVLAGNGPSLPIAPVKGQMLLFDTAAHADAPLLQRVVLKNGRYLIPRDDGRILVGSTLEPHAGFDTRTTTGAAESLHETAISLLPALAQCRIERQWAGLRPGAPDGLPLIGALAGRSGLYVNAGHYRNGLVLAPAATRLLVDQLLGRPTALDPRPYQPPALDSRDRRPSSIDADHA